MKFINSNRIHQRQIEFKSNNIIYFSSFNINLSILAEIKNAYSLAFFFSLSLYILILFINNVYVYIYACVYNHFVCAYMLHAITSMSLYVTHLFNANINYYLI